MRSAWSGPASLPIPFGCLSSAATRWSSARPGATVSVLWLIPKRESDWARAGAEAIEIFCARAHFNYHDRAHIRELAAWFKSNNVKPHSLHSPMFYDEEEFGRGPMEPINIVETDRKRQIEATDEIKRALECAEHIPFRFLVQHLGNGNES